MTGLIVEAQYDANDNTFITVEEIARLIGNPGDAGVREVSAMVKKGDFPPPEAFASTDESEFQLWTVGQFEYWFEELREHRAVRSLRAKSE